MRILSELTVNLVYNDITIGYTNRLCGPCDFIPPILNCRDSFIGTLGFTCKRVHEDEWNILWTPSS